MLGHRDSEVAVIIEDLDFVDGRMNGVEYKMGKFAHSLRCDLLKEHLGLVVDNDEDFHININDPLAESFIIMVYARAELNTISFLKAFGPGLFPRENVEDYEALKRYKDIPLPRENTDTVREVLEQIKGNIVNYPCTFLIKELKPSMFDFGYMFVTGKPQQPVTLYA
jgi:phospholipase D1/2